MKRLKICSVILSVILLAAFVVPVKAQMQIATEPTVIKPNCHAEGDCNQIRIYGLKGYNWKIKVTYSSFPGVEDIFTWHADYDGYSPWFSYSVNLQNSDTVYWKLYRNSYFYSSGNFVVNNCPATAVELASFKATALSKVIQLDWETAIELDNLGFNLWRARKETGTRTQINAALIPSKVPGSLLGATYQFVDTTVNSGVTYYYWLEAIDLYGNSEYHGPVKAIIKSLQRLPTGTQPILIK